MRRSRVLGVSALLILGAILAAVVPASAAQAQVVVGKVIGSHGTLMVAASNGMTLYTFTKDVAGNGKSNCTGGCLTNWPALTVVEPGIREARRGERSIDLTALEYDLLLFFVRPCSTTRSSTRRRAAPCR